MVQNLKTNHHKILCKVRKCWSKFKKWLSSGRILESGGSFYMNVSNSNPLVAS